MSKPDILRTLRSAALHAQGLHGTAPFGKGLPAVQRALEHLGYVQIDTLAVVERAHHHTLWTRIPDYRPAHLEQLIRERKAFEYWSHAAAFLPMRDYRFALPRMNAVKRGESKWFASVSKKDEQQVLERIRSDGPLRARDFESAKQQPGSWWNWKPAKKALEKLFFQGELMIASREGMQKVYDLRERVLPADADTREPTLREYAEHLLNSSLTAHGFTTRKQVTYQRQGVELRQLLNDMLRERVAQGTLSSYSLPGLPTLYGAPDLLERKLPTPPKSLRLLSPFDSAVIHRARLVDVFCFDYRIECYTPQAQRQFGYFCLPMLYAGELVGRVDCKADRENRHLQLRHLHIEATIKDEGKFVDAFVAALRKFATFNGCDTFSVVSTSPAHWKRQLAAAAGVSVSSSRSDS